MLHYLIMSNSTNYNETLFNFTTYPRDGDRNTTNYSCIHDFDPDSMKSFYFYIFNGIILNIVGVAGIIGNIMTMIIFSGPMRGSTTNYLLFALASCELMINGLTILLAGLPKIFPHTGAMYTFYYHVYPRYMPYLFPIWMMSLMTSVYLTLAVTIERFIATHYPLRVRTICTYRRARWTFLAIVIFSIAYNIPRFWEIKYVEWIIEENNSTYNCLLYTQVKHGYYFRNVYGFWLYSVFLFLIPFGGIAVLNALILKAVRKSNRRRKELSSFQRKENDITKMLLMIVLVFLCCNILGVVGNYIKMFQSNGFIWAFIDNFLIALTSVLNLAIYLIFVKTFRHEFIRLCTCYRLDATSRNASEQSTSQVIV